jgi:hypothetical protein
MKKILVMVIAAMMAAMNVNAQEEEYLKHEIGVSYGMLSNSTWMSIGDAIGTAIFSLGSIRYDDDGFFGPLALEYFYHLDPVVGVGVIGVYAQETQNMFIGKEPWGDAKNTYLTFLPAMKFNWLRKEYIGLYSKIGAGVTIRTQKEDYSKSNYEDVSKSKVFFNWQLTGIGFEVGPKNFRGFVEAGLGEQGMALAGLRCKF